MVLGLRLHRSIDCIKVIFHVKDILIYLYAPLTLYFPYYKLAQINFVLDLKL